MAVAGGLALPGRSGGLELVSNANNLLFTTGEPAYAVDDGGRIVAWNKAAERTFGFSRSTAIGANCWELLQGRDVFDNQYCGRRCPHREMAFKSTPINRCRMRFRLANGRYADYLLSTLTLQESSGRRVLVHLCRKESADIDRAAQNGRASPRCRLTARETEVLSLLAQGQATSRIAASLSISITTVRNHIEHLLQKLGCHSRLEAVVAARKQGLI